MSLIVVDSPADFEAKFNEVAGHDTVIAIFKGSVDPATGVSWCDDCELAEPFIQSALQKAGTRPVLICEVGQRDAWRGRAEHPYRNLVNTRVSGVPTVIRYMSGSEVGRLVESQLQNQRMVDELIAG
jgi:hypothetical protein